MEFLEAICTKMSISGINKINTIKRSMFDSQITITSYVKVTGKGEHLLDANVHAARSAPKK